MDRETQDYYENYFMMFATPGWKQFIEDMTDAIDQAKLKAFDKDLENFNDIKAEVKVTNKILSMEATMTYMYDMAKLAETEEEIDESL